MMLKRMTIICCLFISSTGFSSDYLRNIQYDENHSHPLPKLVQNQLVVNPKNPLGELVANSLTRFKCAIKTEEGESFKLGAKQDSYQIGDTQYLTANIFALKDGDYYGAIGIITPHKMDGKVPSLTRPAGRKVLELIEMVEDSVEKLQPKVLYEGQEYSLSCS